MVFKEVVITNQLLLGYWKKLIILSKAWIMNKNCGKKTN